MNSIDELVADKPITETTKIDISETKYRRVNQGPKNLDQKPGECKHKWLYGGGQMWCGLCGWYKQPDGSVTSTPGGRGGKVLEVLGENVSFREAYDPDTQSGLDTKSAEKMIGTVAASIISSGENGKNVNQHVLTTLSNLVNNNGLLGKWCKGFNSLKLTLLPPKSNLEAEFVPPAGLTSSDFIQRFVDGKETFNGFLHRSPTINLRLSPRVFKRLKERDQLINLLRSAVAYYDTGLDKVSREMMVDIFRMGHTMKQLIVTTPMIGLVTFPFNCLMSFEHVDITGDPFTIDRDVVKTCKHFLATIREAPKATREEQEKLVRDLTRAVEEVSQQTGYSEITKSYTGLPGALSKLYEHGYDNEIGAVEQSWVNQQVDPMYYTEAAKKFKIKRLKKLSMDIITYVSIEGEAIRDANDKMLIVAYGLGKVELCQWYIELIDCQSKNYIVPHTRDYLVNFNRLLTDAIKKIMNRPVPKVTDDTVFTYPKGYEG